MLTSLLFYGAWGLVALRGGLAAVLMVHGWMKLKNLRGTGEWFASIGFRPGRYWGTLAAILEFFGGFALALGLCAQPVAFLLAGQFVVILIWRFKTRSPFVGGWELDLLALAGFIVIFFLGAGAWSLDRALLLHPIF